MVIFNYNKTKGIMEDLGYMETFNGDKELKKELVKQLKHHEKLDAFKGSFYGCIMQTDDSPREKFSEKYNIPLWYCYLTEHIFENLPKEQSKTFPVESIEILDVGIDLNQIRSKFNYKQLESLLEFCKNSKNVTSVIKQCMELFTVSFDKIDMFAAESVGTSASRSAAWSAKSDKSAARSAAWSARSAGYNGNSAELSVRSTELSAKHAAESAAEFAGTSVQDYYIKLRDLLFESINECKLEEK